MKKANLREFTFPDSGRVIYVPNISIGALQMKLQRKFPRPLPPQETVDYGGTKRREFNYLHPDYKESLAVWEEFVNGQAMQLALSRLFDIKLSAEQQAEVEAWKEANPGLWDEDDDDKSLWIEEIALGSDDDMQALIDFIQGLDPTQEGIEAAAEGF